MKARSGDFWSGLALGGLGVYIIVDGARLGIPRAGRPGAGVLPALVRHRHGWCCRLMLVVSSARSKTAARIDWTGARGALRRPGRRSP